MIESLQFALANICRRLCDSCDTTIYGQDEHWVRNNFEKLRKLDPDLDDADDILRYGYAAWVDRRVGYSLENGLYKLTATFTNTPSGTVWLDVGELTVAVTNAGDYVFLLKKGVDYEFGTRPYFDGVEYQMQDDLIVYRPLMSAWWDDWNTYGVWTIGGGERSLDYPEVGRPGYCVWLPTLRGSPDVTHLGPSGFPSEFTAVLSVINPSFLNPLSDAVFRVEVNPAGIPSSRINWRAATGSAAFPSGTNGTETVVLGSSGMVDLEVNVLGATDERMHFKSNVQ